MRRPPLRAIGLATIAIAVFPGCSVSINDDGGGSGESLESRLQSLEDEIRSELGGQMTRRFGARVEVTDVGCSGTGGNRFECLAEAREVGSFESESIPISGSCDERNCVWRTGY